MDVQIKSDDFAKALKEYVKLSGKEVPKAINKQFAKAIRESGKGVKVARKSDINRLKKGDALVPLALKNLKGKPDGRPMRVRVQEYINRVVAAKASAVRFTKAVVQAMSFKAAGQSPKVGSLVDSITMSGRQATETYHNAYVRYEHTFKSSRDRNEHAQIIESAIDKGFAAAIQDMAEYPARAMEKAAKQSGLK